MTEEKPRLYLLHGEDELEIKQHIEKLILKMGEPGMAALNTSRLQGGSFSLEDLRSAVLAVPFMLPRRLVIVESILSSLVSESMRESFIDILEHIPASTGLVIAEYRTLIKEVRRNEKAHWLQVWLKDDKEWVYERKFRLPEGGALVKWIQQTAEQLGGVFSYEAAGLLAEMVGQDTRLARQEIEKLLVFVNFSRAVTAGDVQKLTPYSGTPADFALANAIREGNQKEALRILHQELRDHEPVVILHSIVAMFRSLLKARDVIDRGGGESDVMKELRISQGHARHLTQQARDFPMSVLQVIYHKLLEIDEAIKTGQMEGEVALDVFIASFKPLS